jgi:hypothetical protein
LDFTVIKEPDKIDRDAWREFVLNHDDGNIFHTPEYFDLCNSIPEYSGVALFCVNGGMICGVLVSVIQREDSGFVGWLTARSVVFGGPLVMDNDCNVASLLLAEYNYVVRKKTLYSQFRNLKDMSLLGAAFSSNGYAFEDHLDIHIYLSKGRDVLWSEVHSTRRRTITRGLKLGVSVSAVDIGRHDVIDACYAILKARYKQLGVPLPSPEYFKYAAEILGINGMLRLFVAEIDSKLIGFYAILCFKEKMYNWYVASVGDDNDKRPTDVLSWKIFLWGIDNGYSMFDFGGAGKPGKPYGVRDYKKKFGGETVNIGRYLCVHKKTLYSIIMFGYKMRKIILRKR